MAFVYIISGVLGGLTHFWIRGSPLVGASGGVFGLLAFCFLDAATNFWHLAKRFTTMSKIKMKIKTTMLYGTEREERSVLLWLAQTVSVVFCSALTFITLFMPGGNTSHWTHGGGFAAGFVVLVLYAG